MLKLARGIHQRDPISPYLYLICAKGLSSLLESAERRGDIRGVAVTRGGIRVNHLLFADDSVIFGRAKLTELVKIQGLLSTYEKALGQYLNKQKTSIFSDQIPLC